VEQDLIRIAACGGICRLSWFPRLPIQMSLGEPIPASLSKKWITGHSAEKDRLSRAGASDDLEMAWSS